MRRKQGTWHKRKLSHFAIRAGMVDYFTASEVVGAELYDIYAVDEGDWELVNGDDKYYIDGDGNTYDSEMAYERGRELETMIDNKEEGQDISNWERDIDLLTNYGEVRWVYDYYKITEEGAKILMNESNELVYYNSEIDVYVWGICHYGMSLKLIPTSIPI